MSYTITTTSGTTIATIADGTVNNTNTSLTLIGKNYAGYGVFLNENFVKLLENFSYGTPPATPLTGQIWYDTSVGVLKVYTGSNWKAISSSASGATSPVNPVIGDLWWDSTNSQLKVWSGTTWVIIGPSYTSTSGTSGALVETILDTSSISHVIVKFYISNTVVGILSKDAVFTPQTSIAGFSTIKPGFNLVSTSAITGSQFSGDASNALSLQGITANQLLRSDQNTSTSYNITAGGLTIGSDLSISSVSASEVGIVNTTLNKDLNLYVNAGGVQTRAIGIFGSNAAVFLNGASLSVAGNARVTGALTAASNLTVSGTATFNQTVTVGGAVLPNSTNSIDLGSNSAKFANIYATGFIGALISSTLVSIPGVTKSGTDGVGDIGQSNNKFNNIYASNFVGGATHPSITKSGTDGVGDIGQSNNKFNNIYANNFVGNISSSSPASVPSITKIGTDGVGDIGQSNNKFGNVWATTFRGTSITAQYADLAERFAADQSYTPGTVVALGGAKEITAVADDLSEDVFGVISKSAAFLMNGGAGDDVTHPAVAVSGRVPVRVIGRVKKGDRLVAAGNGLARSARRDEINAFNVIGRSLESKENNSEGIVEAIVKLNS
jgi:hypothetical protein